MSANGCGAFLQGGFFCHYRGDILHCRVASCSACQSSNQKGMHTGSKQAVFFMCSIHARAFALKNSEKGGSPRTIRLGSLNMFGGGKW